MAELIWDLNEFMNREFDTIAMGLTPSGHLHLGFLSTLACALLYLKEHPSTKLIITDIENSLASRLEKYNGVPLRFQYLEDGELIIPVNYEELKKRNTASYAVHNELVNLIWQLVHILDSKTKAELKTIQAAALPPEHRRLLEHKDNKVFHIFNNPIHIYSFLAVLPKARAFRTNMIKLLTDFEFAKAVGPLCGIEPTLRNFGNAIQSRGKTFQPKCFQIPIRLYCPNCHSLCPEWARVVLGHPGLGAPTFAAQCKNVGNCPRADQQSGYDGYVYNNLFDSLDMVEFHFMLDPMRDFFEPFKADCHIFGGDYFQLVYDHSGVRAIDKIESMFAYLEQKTGQKKAFFGGPLITMNGMKMSKSGQALNLKDVGAIRSAFASIVDALMAARRRSYPGGIQIEYDQIMRWKAA